MNKNINKFCKIYLEQLEQTIQQVNQWLEMGQYQNAGDYASQLEALVELGEIRLCGSVGGFDGKGGQTGNISISLNERAQHILNNKNRL